MAASLPTPGPFTNTTSSCSPCSRALRARGFRRGLRGERGRLLRALETERSRRRPGDGVPHEVGDGHDRVVEGGLDEGLPFRDILLLFPLGLCQGLILLGRAIPRPTASSCLPRKPAVSRSCTARHVNARRASRSLQLRRRPAGERRIEIRPRFARSMPYFFLFPATVFRLPLRVRAFVFVRWPLTGRPRRWRMPR